MSDSLWPYGLKSARLFCPWDFPGKNTGVGCHFLLQGSSWPRAWTCISCIFCIGRCILCHWATREAHHQIFLNPWQQLLYSKISTTLSFQAWYANRIVYHVTILVLAFLLRVILQRFNQVILYLNGPFVKLLLYFHGMDALPFNHSSVEKHLAVSSFELLKI